MGPDGGGRASGRGLQDRGLHGRPRGGTGYRLDYFLGDGAFALAGGGVGFLAMAGSLALR